MQSALGEDFLRGVPARVRDGLRPRPIVAIDLFRGIDFGEPSLVRGIPVAAPDGQQLTLDVYRPVADGRFPAVVQIRVDAACRRETLNRDGGLEAGIQAAQVRPYLLYPYHLESLDET